MQRTMLAPKRVRRPSPAAFGLWGGAWIHEIAQVVAAALQDGAHSGEIATVGKLTRVMMLAPVASTLGIIAVRRASHNKGQSASPRRAARARGMGRTFASLRPRGLKPLALAAAACIFISIFALVLIKVTAYS